MRPAPDDAGRGRDRPDPGRRERVFTARRTAPPARPPAAACCRALLRKPLMSQRVTAAHPLHGWLWLRRLPVVPRRPHQAPKGMS